ncbi:MAG: hypothetical protein IKU60_02510 [Clostridia bacterium]|nr:hypothetical protein [Clostridia bacterium]
MLKFKKLIVASLAVAASMFSASICAGAAQIDCLSIVDNTLYASVTAENGRLYVAERNEGLLSDAFFADIGDDGIIELPVGKASEYTLYLWDKDSLAPISATYNVVDGVAYMDGSTTAVPEYDFADYTFNQDDDVMIVSAISEDAITGFKAGVETTYPLTDTVTILGLSDSVEDVVPGSVVLIGTNKKGDCAAIELLASIGIPVDEEVFKADYGTHNPSDGSTGYVNMLNMLFSKSSIKLKFINDDNSYSFESGDVQCYRVGIAMEGDTPIITYTASSASAPKTATVFKSTAEFSHYVYARVNTETSKITQCVFYCVPKDFNPGAGDDEYTDIFSLKPIVIIE